MELDVRGNEVILKNPDSFEPEHILECGQAFRWEKMPDESYILIAKNRVINIGREGKDIVFRNTNLEDFENIWIDYFDLKTDYNEIKDKLAIDETLKDAMDYGYGIRILNQDPFETIISFIISANNRIPQIKKSIDLLSQTYGKSLGILNNREYFSFPEPKDLANIDPGEVREICRVGFRDKRIVDTSKMIATGEFDLEGSENMDREELREELMKFPGVGPKVADCILLFGYDKKDSFPVDVWIKRVMETLYLNKTINKKKVGDFGRKTFGEYAGVANQYLFYYGRENEIGKNKNEK